MDGDEIWGLSHPLSTVSHVCAFLKTLIRQALTSGIKNKEKRKVKSELGKTSMLLQAIIHLNKIVNQLNKNSRHDILCHVVSGL